MKKLLLLILGLPLFIYGQDSSIDLSVEDKKLTDFEWKDDVLYIEISSGTKTYGNKKNLEHKIILLNDYSEKNIYSSEKLSSKEFLNKKGALAIRSGKSYAASRILLKGNDTAPLAFYDINSIEIGITKKLENSKIYYDGSNENTFLADGYLISVGPKKKHTRSKSEREGKPIEWFLYKMDLNTMEQTTSTFNLDGINNKSGYFHLIDVGLDRFYICNKKYKWSNDKDEADSQEITMYQYDFDGNEIDKTEMIINLSDPDNYDYAHAQLERAFSFRINPGYPSVLIPNNLATGTIYVDTINKWYYIVSLLRGEKNKIGMRANIAKFDFKGNKIWFIDEPFSEKTEKKQKTKYTRLDPIFTKDNVYFINRLGELITIDNKGNIKKRDLKEGKGKKVNDKLGLSVLWKYGAIMDGFSKKILFDFEAIAAEAINEELSNYLKSLKPKSDTFIKAHFSDDGSINILQIGDKERKVKLLKFM